ncbi:MAG: Serine/threonine-protein phosphatase 2A activator 2 [Bogoriella megaspora]|nr:MAG: Serine/threonine-protein phosphatase 2A activator 2 [Bogoriella megaspora]
MPSATVDPTQKSPDLSQKLPKLVSRKRPRPVHESPVPSVKTTPLPLPPPLDSIRFTVPTRRILSIHDHELFLKSPTYTLLTSFIFTFSDSVRDKPISSISTSDLDPSVTAILSVLDSAQELLKEHPPEDNGGSRFGNPAFRSYVNALTTQLPAWHSRLPLPPDFPSEALIELTTYISNSLGSASRIDYGSGHELNFLLWLLCLNRLSLLPPPTFPSLVLIVFPKYLELIRAIQTAYYLEPAGSHGVWGLDDYQFLPFLFGASQLVNHPYLRPGSIHSQLTLEEEGKDYLYLNQVAFVNSMKNVEGLRWHSPMLDDISASKNWGKVEQGMRRMFEKEVLGKVPVMQHFLFGGLIPAVDGMSREEDAGGVGDAEGVEEGQVVIIKDGMRHVHNPNSWGDCCGIKVPGSVGAAGETRRAHGQGLRRVPFD